MAAGVSPLDQTTPSTEIIVYSNKEKLRTANERGKARLIVPYVRKEMKSTWRQ